MDVHRLIAALAWILVFVAGLMWFLDLSFVKGASCFNSCDEGTQRRVKAAKLRALYLWILGLVVALGYIGAWIWSVRAEYVDGGA